MPFGEKAIVSLAVAALHVCFLRASNLRKCLGGERVEKRSNCFFWKADFFVELASPEPCSSSH